MRVLLSATANRLFHPVPPAGTAAMVDHALTRPGTAQLVGATDALAVGDACELVLALERLVPHLLGVEPGLIAQGVERARCDLSAHRVRSPMAATSVSSGSKTPSV